MRESSDTTKCVTMLRHLAGTIILILFGISCAEKRSWTEVTFEHDSYIKVPLTINGDVHWYIFDTGAGVSTILSELAVKYNLRNEREEELAEKIEQGIYRAFFRSSGVGAFLYWRKRFFKDRL